MSARQPSGSCHSIHNLCQLIDQRRLRSVYLPSRRGNVEEFRSVDLIGSGETPRERVAQQWKTDPLAAAKGNI